MLRAQVHTTDRTGDILAMLNELLYEDLSRAELFITMFYVKYDAANRTSDYSSAGHNHPLLYRRGSLPCTELDAEGLILGVKRDVVFEEMKHCSCSRAISCFCILTESPRHENASGDLFGEERLCQILADAQDEHPDQLIDRILNEVAAFYGSPAASGRCLHGRYESHVAASEIDREMHEIR